MKQLLFAMLFIGATYFGNAQLANTKWKGVLVISDDSVNVIFDFKQDSLVVMSADENEPIETMSCSYTADSFTIAKLSGQSDCGETPAIYTYTITNDKLTIAKKEDDCEDRYSVIDNTTYTKL